MHECPFWEYLTHIGREICRFIYPEPCSNDHDLLPGVDRTSSTIQCLRLRSVQPHLTPSRQHVLIPLPVPPLLQPLDQSVHTHPREHPDNEEGGNEGHAGDDAGDRFDGRGQAVGGEGSSVTNISGVPAEGGTADRRPLFWRNC
jgi:hypothetical protein